ncbi:uncharacterized protein LOC113232535 [Hyposmocoma kahamanoa]|uniref:uncharacterized protein LOC113232535 n=1 Tax=Hyposmocoma kahamanoa TaxID=1477025 RepID=UPI000E6D613E|nr:uncharacterized protein LOC113232535 [Hyposmocoma kahamanoa]
MCSKGLDVNITRSTRTMATMFKTGFQRVYPAHITTPKSGNSHYYSMDSSISYAASILTSSQRERRNNSTIYRVDTVGYGNKLDKKKRRFRIIAVTKTNTGTYTDNTTNLVNNSTMTSNMFNPVLDRRDKSISLVKDRALMVKLRLKRKETKSQSVSTDGRVVTFRSSTEIIPNVPDKTRLSPSRYLLESQKYYNELFYGGATAGMRYVPHYNIDMDNNEEFQELDGKPSMEFITFEQKARKRSRKYRYILARNNISKMVKPVWEYTPATGDYHLLIRSRPPKKRSTTVSPSQRKTRNYWTTNTTVYLAKKLVENRTKRKNLYDDSRFSSTSL